MADLLLLDVGGPAVCLQVEAAQPFNLHKNEGLIRRQTKQAPLVQLVRDRSGSVQ